MSVCPRFFWVFSKVFKVFSRVRYLFDQVNQFFWGVIYLIVMKRVVIVRQDGQNT